jgi:hypothetical protein
VWEDHQVLAYGYEDASPGTYESLYLTPNYPVPDEICTEAECVNLGDLINPTIPQRKATICGLHGTQRTPRQDGKIVRGCFMKPHIPVEPPANL